MRRKVAAVIVVSMLAVGAAIFFLRAPDQSLAVASAEANSLRPVKRMAEIEARAIEAEKDVAELLGVIERMKQQQETVRDSKLIEAEFPQRLRQVRELWNLGRHDEAVAQLVSYYERYRKIRSSGSQIKAMHLYLIDYSKTNAVAKAALLAIRNAALRDLEAGAAGTNFIETVADINAGLGELSSTVKLYDSLPEGDRRKQRLGQVLFDEFAAEGRYADAVRAKPYSSMLNDIDWYARSPARGTENESAKRSRAGPLAMNLEVLMANRQYEEAAMYSRRLVRVEDSGPVAEALRKTLSKSPEGQRILRDLASPQQ